MDHKYYAFISYARENIDAAKKIKHFLEAFRYPEFVQPDFRPNHKKFLRSIALDKDNLTGNADLTIQEDLENKIRDSRYLIVLCSPFSAQRKTGCTIHWCEWEVQTFLKTHNNNLDLIVPVILDGNPDLTENSCLLPSLRQNHFLQINLPDFRPDKMELAPKKPDLKQNWDNGCCVLISRLLHLDREQVKDVYQKERRRKVRNYMIASLVVLAVFAGLLVWAVRAERIADANMKRAVAAEKEARHQAALAQESLIFLKNALGRADVRRGGNSGITIVEALKKSIPGIYKLKQWELQMSIADMVSTILVQLNQYSDVEPLWSFILQQNKAQDVPPEKIAYSYHQLGRVQRDMKKYPAAERSFAAAEHIYRELCKKNPEKYRLRLSALLNSLAMLQHAMEHYTDAEKTYLEALAPYRKRPMSMAAQILNNLGLVQTKMKHYADAEKSFRQSLRIYRKVAEIQPRLLLGLSYPLTNFGALRVKQKNYFGAEEMLNKALKIRRDLAEKEPEAYLPLVAYSLNRR